MGSGRGWLAGDWPSTGGVLNITTAAWTVGFQWWRSGNVTRTENVSEYVLVLALCLVFESVPNRARRRPLHRAAVQRCRYGLSSTYRGRSPSTGLNVCESLAI